MKKLLIVVCVVLFLGGIVYWNAQKASPQPQSAGKEEPPIQDLSSETPVVGVNKTDVPLEISDGFEVSVFAEGLRRPRVLVFDPGENLLVSEMEAGRVTSLPDADADGKADQARVVVDGLNRPHGLAFDSSGRLYIAETGSVARYAYDVSGANATQQQRLVELPAGGNHFTRTIGIGPDEKLYVSTGSTCNVCIEKDERRAAIWVSELDGSGFRSFATGLRNSVFFAWHPLTQAVWATDNGRDQIGDDIPPEEINIVEDGKFYGWPFCYGKKIHDAAFDRTERAKERCAASQASYIDMQAHSAAMSLVFVPPDSSWPVEYWHNLIVAFRGSWNRTVATGYKLIRIKLDNQGVYLGQEDFVTGWLPADARGGPQAGQDAYGRPVGLAFNKAGNLFVSDDTGGRIYIIHPIKE